MDYTWSPDKKWQVEWRTLREWTYYGGSETDYEIVVKNVATGEIVETFHQFENCYPDTNQISGARAVEFSDDSKEIIVTRDDGKIERQRLPD